MPRGTYTANEATKTLGISLDTLRRSDRQGRLRVDRDARNRRLVPASEIERLRGDSGTARLAHGTASRRSSPTSRSRVCWRRSK